MAAESALFEAVVTWAKREWPSEQELGEHAAAVAIDCYREGGSIGEACGLARSFAESWVQHPAHPRVVPHLVSAAAS